MAGETLPARGVHAMSTASGRWLVLAAAVLFSTGGAALKTEAFSVAEVSALRSGIAALSVWIWLRGRVRLSPGTLVAAACYALTVTLFVGATRLTTAGSAIFLQASAPLFIAVLGPLLLREPFGARDLPYLALMALGLAVCLSGEPPGSTTAPDPRTGNLLGVACSGAWALTLMALRYVSRAEGGAAAGLAAVVVGNAIACIGALPFAWPFPAATAADWATVVYLGVVQIGVAYACLTSAVRRLPALDVSLMLLVEPVLNPVWTWVVHGEEPGELVIVGGGIILVAAAVRALRTEPRVRTDSGEQ